ncbi:MAG: 4Fe-4S dicluster domain-containing protein [Coriobacteriia bacterium]|nr:4Fe-4S dicluster domain-containing protein [Coriobacteriia bacterium]MCL2750854.1 4Fe-4S dicluster domain-containing protein [Coriobacteriia bacterium]
MDKTTLYYFSATGNSLAVALHLSRLLDIGDPVSVPGSLVNEDPYIDACGAKALGFVFPVQRATIPEMLRGFIQSMPVDPDCYYFAISTFSIFGSNEFWDIDELLVSQGAALNFAASVRMMGNVGLKRPSEATIQKRLELMERQVEEIATAVAYRQENFFPRANKALGLAVRTFTDFRRRHIIFRIDKHCKGCGICVQVCPAQNIHLPDAGSESAVPIRSDKCEACLACVHWCPAAAVSASRRGHTSYHNPLVLPEQLHQIAPKNHVGFPNDNTQLLTGDSDETILSEDLPATSGDDPFASTDTKALPDSSNKADESQEQPLSDEEIAQALSDLE